MTMAQLYHQHTVNDIAMIYIPKGTKYTLASEYLNGDPIATPPLCLYNILLSIKYA